MRGPESSPGEKGGKGRTGQLGRSERELPKHYIFTAGCLLSGSMFPSSCPITFLESEIKSGAVMKINGQCVQSSVESLVHNQHSIYNCCWSHHYGLMFITHQSLVCVRVSVTISGASNSFLI